MADDIETDIEYHLNRLYMGGDIHTAVNETRNAMIWLLRQYAAERRAKVAQEKAPDLSDRG